MSSTTTSMPSMHSNICDMTLWKTSCDDDKPYGSRLNIYLPKGVLKVHSLALSWSS